MRAKLRVPVGSRQAAGMAVLSLLLCGVLFPLVVTAVAQVLFPNQADGSLVSINGRVVGSSLIAQQFSSPMFLHPRPANESASGVDPDIPLESALSQASRIHNATGIPLDQVDSVILAHTERTLWAAGSPYVNVLEVNLALMSAYPAVYHFT